MTNRRQHNWRRAALALLVVAVSLAFTGAASAQTSFQANVTYKRLKPAGACSNGAFFCGTANITGYGPATWNYYLVATPQGTNCFYETAVTVPTTVPNVTFGLSDGSTLELSENDYVCGAGNSFAKSPLTAFGNPLSATGTWLVTSATKQFSGLTGGTGADALHAAGANISGTYTGT